MLPPIKHSVYIRANPQQVFETLTSAKGWDGWFTQGMVLNPHIGGDMIFRWQKWGPAHVTAEDHAEILEIMPFEKFSFLWNKHVGGTTVIFTLEPRQDGTVLQITDEGYQSAEYFSECATGWGEALTLLKFHLEHDITYGNVP